MDAGPAALQRFQQPRGCDVARGMQPPGGAGRVMHPRYECLQNMQRAGLGQRWESELGQLAGSEQLPALASGTALTFECVFCT